MAVAVLLALTSCLLAPASAPDSSPPPSTTVTTPSSPESQPTVPAPAPAPPESAPPPSGEPPAPATPAPTVAEPGADEPGVDEPPPPDGSEPAQPLPVVFDRIERRDGEVVEGKIVEFVPKSHMKIAVRDSEEIRTLSWAEVDYVQRVGEPRQTVSAGKPSIAELAAESERIEKKKKLGLGLAYGGYSTLSLSVVTWGIFTFTKDTVSLTAAVVSTSFTVALLTTGGVIFFRARAERKELRKVIISAAPTSHGGLVGVSGRF